MKKPTTKLGKQNKISKVMREFKAEIQESWKELLLLLLGAFVGNLNKVIDFWFSNEDRDKMLVQKMDEEDNTAKPALESYEEPTTSLLLGRKVGILPHPSLVSCRDF